MIINKIKLLNNNKYYNKYNNQILTIILWKKKFLILFMNKLC